MGSTFAIKPPRDYVLKRDVCSYGYFLLAPNRWYPKESAFCRELTLPEGPATVAITQDPHKRGESLSIACDRRLSKAERMEATRQISRMLRLDEDHEVLSAFHRVDDRWKRSGRGRLFRSPTLFEDVIKTVTSCNVAWPSTIIMNRRLCEVVGERAAGEPGDSHEYWAFPTAEQMARTRPQTIRARCSVGYRDKRIIELGRIFAGKKGAEFAAWLEDPATPDEALHEKLLELPGIGPYAAANIMQLSGRYSRLPCDTESVRHGKAVLGFKGSSAQVMKLVHRHYTPFGAHAFRSYWFELWEHYEKKHGKAWTWWRDTTGKMFTAKELNK